MDAEVCSTQTYNHSVIKAVFVLLDVYLSNESKAASLCVSNKLLPLCFKIPVASM